VETPEALDVLGLDMDASFEDMRSAYRDLLMLHHPDVDTSPGAADRTNDVVNAFRCLRDATQEGLVLLPVQDLLPVLGTDALPLVLRARPGDVFQRLYDAVESIGDISGIDRDSGIVQAIVTMDGTGPCQLGAEIDRSGADPRILFTLEALTAEPPPDIADVVSRLAPHL